MFKKDINKISKEIKFDPKEPQNKLLCDVKNMEYHVTRAKVLSDEAMIYDKEIGIAKSNFDKIKIDSLKRKRHNALVLATRHLYIAMHHEV